MSDPLASPSPPRVVLVGCGAVAQLFYQPALLALERAGVLRVQGLVDPSPGARAKLARAFPSAVSAPSCETVALPPGSLAIIASPPRHHCAQSLDAFQRGWHVLCEKPMASTLEEAHAMNAAAGRHGRLLAVGLYKRFFPSSAYIRALCRGGQLGRLVRFEATEGGSFSWPAASPSFFDRNQTFGGVLADIGVHVLDLAGWWLGPPSEVAYADDAMGGVETNAWIDLTYPSGARAGIHLSRDWQTRQRYTLSFERGTVAWTVNDANGLTVQLDGAPAALRAILVPALEAGAAVEPLATNAQSFIAQLRNVAAAIAGREPLLVPGTDAVDSLALVLDCYASKGLLEQPWLPAGEARRARSLA